VFVQNLAPSATERLGLGTEALFELHPGLIVCDVSGYGASCPNRDKKAYDLLVQCEAALVSVTGTQETPSKAGIAVADIATGMYAYSGILAALFRRERTGEGASIEVSLFEALAEWMGFPACYAMYGEKEPPRSGASHTSIAPYGPFACAGDEVVFLVSRTRGNGRSSVRSCWSSRNWLETSATPATRTGSPTGPLSTRRSDGFSATSGPRRS
jgi:itaconate CoA-transferase